VPIPGGAPATTMTEPRPAGPPTLGRPRPADETPTVVVPRYRSARLWSRDGTAVPGMPLLSMPGRHDPPPDTRRMLGICAWAAALGIFGLAIAARALLAVALGAPPGWYEPTVICVGLLGMALTAAAYLAVQHPRLPWVLLGAATVPLIGNLVATVVAL
jgi:hypothetical protein